MSETELKNGERVYQAAKAVAFDGGGRFQAVFTVREVAKRAGCSKPTAQKYMRVMVENDVIEKHPHYPGANFYRWIAGGE